MPLCTQNNLNHHTKLELVSLSYQHFTYESYIKPPIETPNFSSSLHQWETQWVDGGLWSWRPLCTGCRVRMLSWGHYWQKQNGCQGHCTLWSKWRKSCYMLKCQHLTVYIFYRSYINILPLYLCFRHPLAKAVLLLCKAVQLSISPLKGEGAMSCLSLCDRASSYISSSVAIPLTQSGNLLNKVL